MTPRVKELLILILPATIGAGGYYISQLFYAYFATRLPEGSFVYLSQADRLNQLPLALVGSAIGTAILPAISRHLGLGEDEQAANIQGRATELAMLLTIPGDHRPDGRRRADHDRAVRRRAVHRRGCRDLGAGPVDPRHRPAGLCDRSRCSRPASTPART